MELVHILLGLVSIILTTVMIVVTLTVSLNGRVHKVALSGCFAFLVFVAFLGYSITIHDGFYSLLIFCFPVIAVALIVRQTLKWQLIYLAMLILGITTAIETTIYWIFCIVGVQDITPELIDLIVSALLLVLSVVLNQTLSTEKYFRRILQLKTYLKTLLLCSIWLSVLLTSLTSTIFREYSTLPGFAFAGVLTIILIILTAVLLPLLITNNLSSSYYKNLSDIMDNQVRAQVAHYESISKVYENSRKFQHNYNNLKLGIISALKQGDIDGALSMLTVDEISGHSQVAEYETGSILLDALITEKISAARKENTSIEFSGVVPGHLLSFAEVCIIFGNALDNAIEACAKCSNDAEKVINVHSEFLSGFLFIKIENPVAAGVHIVNNTIATSKKNNAMHGIGLQSILAIVEKHSGDMRLMCNDKKFRLEIDFDFNCLE